MSLIQALDDKKDDLSPQERKLCEYIISNTRETIKLSITQLAEASGCSTSTISRFCRLFHAKNYSEFKLKLAVELTEKPSINTYQDIVAGQSLDQIVTAITTNNIRSVSDTAKLLDYGKLKDAIILLHEAKRIDLYGVATSGIVATDLFQKLIRIGKTAACFTDSHMQQTSASTLQIGDLAIGISYSGETTETIYALQIAKEKGAKTIAITKFGSSKIADVADICLFISSSEVGMRRGDMASRMAQLHLVDILFVGLVSEYFDEHVPRLEQSYQAVKGYSKKIKK